MNVLELMQWAETCAAAGDLDGEIDAYRRADDLGDAAAAVLLGNALRRSGDLTEAKAAFGRGEARGHREAAMSLGNLLSDLGDHAGAEAAYLRSVDQGSTIAALNLGLMLASDGAQDRALPFLQMAADDGDPSGFWGIGKINEQRRNWTKAADAYQQGAELDDPACWLGLGIARYEMGDHDGSLAALERARSLGHDGAAALVAALAGDGDARRPETATAAELWSEVTEVLDVLAAQRQELGRTRIESGLVVQRSQAKQTALEQARDAIQHRLATVAGRFNVAVDSSPRDEALDRSGSVDEWVASVPGKPGEWQLAPAQASAFDADLDEAREALLQAERKRLGGALRGRGAAALGRVRRRLDELVAVTKDAARGVAHAERARSESIRSSAERARSVLEPAAERAGRAAEQLPTLLQPWSSPAWQRWSVTDPANRGLSLCYGGELAPQPDPQLGANASFGTDLRVPCALPLHQSWWLRHDRSGRPAAHGFVRSRMLRQLVAVAPGEVKFCIFDPVGLGQSAGDLLGLAEYDADLIGGKIWSSAPDLEARLGELSAHIELVIQKYLRATYETIDEFNSAAGEIAEPYRVLVLFDFPAGMTSSASTTLQAIIANGPRCGVYCMVVHDTSSPVPYGVEIAQLQSSSIRSLDLQAGFTDTVNGYRLETALDPDLIQDRSEIATRIIDEVGRASIAHSGAAITFERVFRLYSEVAAKGLRPELGDAPVGTRVDDARTWWRGDSTRGLFAPIGQKGAREVAILGFDSRDQAGALMVGRPGSGKSTLLHAYIGGLTTLYSPEELDLYLIDFKEGVEFKAYAEERLPHAKVIAIESDREFGLSVLESLQAEIARRAEVLRGTGGRQAGVQGLREATGDTYPRILLVFDEFQVLFARNDKVGLAAADLLESIIRQGRGFGVHVLLGSQSLAGLDSLGAHVPQLLPVRILLAAAEADGRKVLGDSNNAGDYLTTHGEGILNAAGGAVEANERFRGALLTEADRISRLTDLRSMADERGFNRIPMVFEGSALAPLDAHDPRQFREELASSGRNPIRIRTGQPMTVGDVGDLVLRRETGANVLAIIRGTDPEASGIEVVPEGPAYGLLAATVASAAMSAARIDVIDFMSTDDGADALLEPLLDVRRITLRRRRAFHDTVVDYLAEVEDRINQDDASRAPALLVLFGIHRARDLDADLGSLDADVDLVEKVERLLRDGPEVGVHLWIWTDSVGAASRRLTSRMMRELAWRVGGKMSADDSQTFIGGPHAAHLRESQLVMVNEDHGVNTRMTAFAPPEARWVTSAAAVLDD